MPIQFVGPALQGASLISRVGVPLLQQAGIAAGLTAAGAAINSLINKPQTEINKSQTEPKLTGRQKLSKAWGTIPDDLFSRKGGHFAYRNAAPVYSDAQGNVYDAVSGRLLYPSRNNTRPAGAPPTPQLPSPFSGTTPIIQGTRDGVTPDRTQSDEYKAQMAQYGVLQKAGEFAKATELGREIWKDKYKDTPMAREGGAIGTFNPLMKRTFPEQYGEPTMGPTPAALQADPALKGVTSFFPGAEPGGFAPGVGNPVTPTEAFNQGEVMDANRGVQNLQVWQRAKTNPMNSISQQAFDFISQFQK